MERPELNASYDVVIIGAGVGGLTAAALLSKAGLSVCVLEKEPHAGGYLAGFKRKNFLFDTAIHWLNQYGREGMVTRLFSALGTDHPAAKDQVRIRRYLGNSYNYLLTNNPDELRNQLIAEYPHEKDGIERFFRAAKKIGYSMKNFNEIYCADETKSTFRKWVGKLKMLRFALPFIPYITYSGEIGLNKGLNRFFKDPKLHKIFTSETELIGCMVPIGWAYHGDFQSPPKGGGQVIPQWLMHVVRFFHNPIFFQSRVTEILVKDNACTGVKLECQGNVCHFKSKYVIAASDIETLYEKLLPADAVPMKLKKKLKNAELYSSSVTISIALDCPAEQLGFDEELIHLADEGQPFDAYTSGDPTRTEISIIAASVRDKSLAPPGQGTLTIFMPASMEYRNEWQTSRDEHGNFIRGEAYRNLKNEVAEIIFERVESRLAPGLRSHILFYEVATPVTHYRYTGNKNGTMMGARPGRANMQNKIAHYQTPVKNLILGGHWAELGGGVPIATKAGANASLLILKKENPAAYNALTAYMEGDLCLEQFLQLPCFKKYDNSWVYPLTPSEKKSKINLQD
jgi:phytoene dehydrogenase-like protein